MIGGQSGLLLTRKANCMRKKLGSLFLILLVFGLVAGCSANARKARHLASADKYYAAGEYVKAEIEYLNVVKLDHANAHAIARLGSIYFEEGRPARAFPVVMKALELDPNFPGLHSKAATLYFAVGDLKNARQQANAALDQSPTNSEAAILLAEWARTPKDIEEVRQQLDKLRQRMGPAAWMEVALGTLDLRAGELKAASAAFTNALTLDPKSASAHYALGSLYWSRNDLTNANAELEIAAKLEPLRSIRRLRYADFKVQTGGVEEGKGILSEITRGAPDYLPAWISLAQIALGQRQLTNCAALIKEALHRDPDNYDALLLSARLKLASGEGNEAVSECERLTTIYKNSPQAFYQLGLAYLYKDDVNRAFKSINQAVALDPAFDDAVLMQAELNIQRDHPDPAIESLAALIKRRPGMPLAYLLTANAYIAKGNYDEAVATCLHLQKLYPRNPQVQIIVGGLYLRQGKKDEARRAFNQALEFSPGFTPALEQLVNLDLSEKSYDLALKRVQAELGKTPQSPQLQVLLGQVFMARTNNDDAEQALQKAIALDASYRPPYLMLANLYLRSKQNEKALQKLNDVTAKNPHDVGALMLMGMIQNEMGDYSAARSTYEKLLGINPNFEPALNNLAYLYSEKFNMLDKAFEAARKARDLAPNDPSSEDTLGWILYQRHEYSWALSLLQASAEKLSEEPEIQFHLGMAYYALDDEIRAAKALSGALASPRDFTGKSQIKSHLTVLAMDPEKGGSEMLSELQKNIADNPNDVVALIKMARLYEHQNSIEKAADTYEQALKQNPRNALLMISLADLYAQKLQKPEKAMDLAKEAYKLAPDDEHVTHSLGRLAYAQRDYRWSLSLFQQSIQNHPQSATSFYDLAWAYYSVGQVSDAQAAMRNALKQDSAFSRASEAHQFLALTTLADSPARALESESEIQTILHSDPTNGPALMVAAAAFRQKGDFAAASRTYDQVLVRYPDFIPAVKQLAILTTDHSVDDRKAYELAVKARAGMPDDPEVARTLGILSYRRGDFQATVRFLSQSAQGGISDGSTLYYLGMAYYQLKDSRQSKDALQRALATKLSPQFSDEAKRVLRDMK
jgi:tetratricopeptide (TPR) repeat protein